MKLQERQAVTAGIVCAVLMPVVAAGAAIAGQRTETFLKALGACLIAGGIALFFVHKLNRAPDPPKG
jgi:predicted phage tail protein